MHAPQRVRIGRLGQPGFRVATVWSWKLRGRLYSRTKLLSGAGGPVMVGGHYVQGKLALELYQGFLLRARPPHKGPHRSFAERLVGGHGGILEVPVIGGKELELKCLPAPMMHALARSQRAGSGSRAPEGAGSRRNSPRRSSAPSADGPPAAASSLPSSRTPGSRKNHRSSSKPSYEVRSWRTNLIRKSPLPWRCRLGILKRTIRASCVERITWLCSL